MQFLDRQPFNHVTLNDPKQKRICAVLKKSIEDEQFNQKIKTMMETLEVAIKSILLWKK